MTRRTTFEVLGSPEHFIVPVLNKEIHILLNLLTLPKGATVLDIGCGNQPLRKFAEQKEWQYTSMDIAQNNFNNVDILGKIDEDIDVKNKFDLLIITEVMEHVLYWEKAFSNFRMLCKPSSKVLITCPFFYPLHEEPYDYWRPTPYALASYANKFDFKIVSQKRAGSIWDVLGTLLNSIYITQDEDIAFAKKIKIWLLSKILKYLKGQIISGEILHYTTAEGNWYLSNVLLLEKKID